MDGDSAARHVGDQLAETCIEIEIVEFTPITLQCSHA
jgi:hypothetical protein